MRKITQQAVEAMFRRKKFKKSNTEILVDGDYSAMFLHGNKIAEIDNYQLFIKAGNWKTTTTKERLNGVLSNTFRYYSQFYKIVQRDFRWFIEVYSIDNNNNTIRIYDKFTFAWDGHRINVKDWIKDQIRIQK